MRRRLDAALLLDKPVGLSSNVALQAAKRLFRAEKAGHAGTLDPLASGLLLLLFGDATKFAGPQLDADKSYLATVRLGVTTTTGDAEGEVIERRSVSASTAQVETTLEKFRGPIWQVPPMYSALKLEGKPLYLLAREGKTVERRPRAISIHELEQVSLREDFLTLRVRCSKGTYVRSLAEDIGRVLGTGAHLAALRRTSAGGLSLDGATTLDALAEMTEEERNRRLLPLDALLGNLPRLDCGAEQEVRLRKGQAIQVGQGLVGQCALHGPGGLIGVGLADGAGMLRPVRLTALREDQAGATG
ncbi:MAG: tRNA pseudouridine(55) synthase TruB [Burkholderiales bacterium]|jgi:tRNA pseudouridine55 synthase